MRVCPEGISGGRWEDMGQMNQKTKNLITLLTTVVLVVLVAALALNGFQVGKYIFLKVGDAVSLGLDLRGGVYAVYVATDPNQEDFESLLHGTISVLRNRLTQQGFTEATVTQQGSDRIRVEIPDVADPNEILDIIGTPAHLTITDPDGNIIIEGKDIKMARAGYADPNSPENVVVHFELNESGKEAFATATANNIGKQLTISLDGDVISAPVVQSAITGGYGYIDGMKDAQDAINLANLIMSGALPLDIREDEVRTVSATLGDEAMEKALLAGVVGLILVIVFMIAVYRLPGIVASLALCIYVLIVMYSIALIRGVQLTLPGIAGVLLGIGMAVDANVVIFERMREEIKSGRSLESAVNRGFKNALSAVIDSNVTTIICGLVLLYFGTGTIKGFAMTLLIGVVASMFTAVFVTRFLLKRVVGLGIKNIAWYTR